MSAAYPDTAHSPTLHPPTHVLLEHVHVPDHAVHVLCIIGHMAQRDLAGCAVILLLYVPAHIVCLNQRGFE